jgi:hypothetical protein
LNTESSLIGCQGEGGRASQFRPYSPHVTITGGQAFFPVGSTAVGLLVGDADFQALGIQVSGLLLYGFSSSSGPAVDLSFADAENSIEVVIDQDTGARVAVASGRVYNHLRVVNFGAATPFSDAALAINFPSTTTYTLAMSDAGGVVQCANASPITVTVPTNASVAFPIGTVIEVDQAGAGQVTITGAGGVTVHNSSSATTRAQWSAVRLLKTGTDTWLLTGDLT